MKSLMPRELSELRNVERMLMIVLSLVLIFLLVVTLPKRIYEDVERQSLNPAGLHVGPDLSVFYAMSEGADYTRVLHAPPDQHIPFLGHAWLLNTLVEGPVWLRFDVSWLPEDHAANELAVFLSLGFATLNQVDFFLLDQHGKLLQQQRAGDHVALAERPLPLATPVFPFVLKAGIPVQVLMRVHTDSFLNAPLNLSSAAQMVVSSTHMSFLVGVFYGVMLIMLFYNLFIYTVVRKISYLYYVFYVLFATLYQSVSDGVFHQYLWQQSGWLLDRGLVFFAGIANLLAVLFVRSLLRLKRYSPTFYALSQIVVLLIVLACIAEAILRSNLSSLIMMAVVALSCLIVPVIGCVAWFKGSPIARPFLVAWVFYPCVLLVYLATMSGLISPSYETVNALRIGTMTEATLMSLALAAYIAYLRQEKLNLQKSLADGLELQIDDLAKSAFALSQGDYSRRARVQPGNRLATLAVDFNHMASQLQRLSDERKRWMADVSHEFSTPVAILRGTLESFQTGAMEPDSETLALLHDETLRLDRLIQELHQINEVDTGRAALSLRWVDLDQLLQAFLHDNAERLDAAQITVDLCLMDSRLLDPHQGASEALLQADPDRLRQVFTNLLSNTIMYTTSPGRLRLSTSRDGKGIQILWEDSAPGATEQDYSLLFERLYRGEHSRNRQSGGSGLGLSICKAIVEAHHGSITARPSALGGLCVQIWLPLPHER